MDLAPGAGGSGGGGGGGSDDDCEDSSSKRRKLYHRHSADKIHRLEEYFKDCPHPGENQRQQLSRELRLEPKQIKFWFQNKRTQTKAQNDRLDNHALKAENERFQCENIAMKEALKNVICPKCEGLGYGEQARQQNLQRLRNENIWLKKEYDRVSNIVSNFYKRRYSPLESLLTSASRPSLNNFYEPKYFGQGIIGGRGEKTPKGTSYGIDQYMSENFSMNPTINPLSQNQFLGIHELERSVMIETAINAMDELIDLLRVNEPLWIRSSTDGRFVIDHEAYNKLYPKIIHVNTPQAWMESSRESGIVSMTALNLLEIFQNPKKWMDFFPTIVTKARIVEVIDTRNRGGSLYLMQEKLHVLSPFIAPREFMFLRYIRQLTPTTWLIVQASFDSLKDADDTSSPKVWMLPSGCMIEDMSDGKSKVTWIEHAQVDDKSLTHQLYKDMVYHSYAYGAKRWLITLQRMCERHAFSVGSKTISGHDLERVIDTPQSRSSMTNLAHKMVKSFHEILSLQEKTEFPQLSQYHNKGFRISFRRSDFISATQPSATIVCVAATLRLHLVPFQNLFNFFKDDKVRTQWDVLYCGSSIHEIAHISTGHHPGNSISLMQPCGTNDNTSMLILQESYIDTIGASIIYAPIEFPVVASILSGQDAVEIPILPSGLVISSDHGGVEAAGGISDLRATSSSSGPNSSRLSRASLLTMTLQVLVPSDNSSPEEPNMKAVATILALVDTTVQKIKSAIGSN